MAFITFVTPYKPIVCGIADYSHFVVRECPSDKCDVLSFDLEKYGVPLHEEPVFFTHPVQYIIPNRDDYEAGSILKGLAPDKNQALWFQHEFGIWRDNTRFIKMLKELTYTKIVSLHSVHFQSNETDYGLRKEEHSFLSSLLPNIDAITLFSRGAYESVIRAFPEYVKKVRVLKHGNHIYPAIAGMSREAAKLRIHEYLIHESRLDQACKDNLIRQSVFLDPDTIVIGGAGFITASKGTELLCEARDRLQEMLPEKKIVAVHTGFLRDTSDSINSKYIAELKTRFDGKEKFLLETYLPGNILPVLLRALDIYFYWPSDCTQSGILAHALGAGAVVVCRDMEGVGETVNIAGGFTSSNFDHLVNVMRYLICNPVMRKKMSERAFAYAEEYCWNNQAREHFQIVEQLQKQPAEQFSLAASLKTSRLETDIASPIRAR